jgi:acyl carrier protein
LQIHADIRDFIRRDLARDVAGVDDEQSLLEAGILDSLGVLALVSFIEERYGIAVLEDELLPENFDSIEAIAAFVGRRRGDPRA